MHATTRGSTPRQPTFQQQTNARRHWQRGVGLLESGAPAPAAEAFRMAVGLHPGDSLYWLNLAHALMHSGDAAGASDAARRALELDPQCAPACELAVDQLFAQHRYQDAVDVMRQLGPGPGRDKMYYANLGGALLKLGRPKEAIEELLLAVGKELHFPAAHFRMGVAFKEMGLNAEAAECFRTSYVLQPHYIESLEQAVHHNLHACRWEGFDADNRTIVDAHAAGRVASTVPFCLITLPVGAATLRASAAVAAEKIEAVARRDALPARAAQPREDAKLLSDRKLRVGYVSNDFRYHATSMLMADMLERRDRAGFEVTLYSHGADDGSPMRKRMEAACDRFVDITQRSDRDAAERVRADGIDILVDLKGYTLNHRLGLFALRPAPVQVAFLGFPGTTGGSFIDYFIGDPVVTPLDTARFFSEKLAQMPVCYQPNDRARPLSAPTPRRELGLPEDAFVMVAFNQLYKITPQVFDVWCRLLKEIPNAVLWLLRTNPQAEANLLREAERRGIDAARLVFAPVQRQQPHLARIAAGDLFLDTTPCAAHTTASDTLWAGVPLVTVLGETFPSRVAGSLLNAVGLPELVATDLDQYADIVRGLAADPQKLSRMRSHLADVRMTTPLFDAERYARDIEALFRRMASRHAAGLAPDHLPAAA